MDESIVANTGAPADIAPGFQRLDHYNIETSQPEPTVAFYVGVLGFEDLSKLRPDVGRPGTWFGIDGHPSIHVNFVDHGVVGPTGAIDHVAFEGRGYRAMRSRLDQLGVPYRAVESPHLALHQLYVNDPNGIQIEINIRGETVENGPA